jgi:hypothetical protein
VADGIGKDNVEAAWKSGLQEAAIFRRLSAHPPNRSAARSASDVGRRRADRAGSPVAGHVDLDRLWEAESRVGKRAGKDGRNDKDAEEES